MVTKKKPNTKFIDDEYDDEKNKKKQSDDEEEYDDNEDDNWRNKGDRGAGGDDDIYDDDDCIYMKKKDDVWDDDDDDDDDDGYIADEVLNNDVYVESEDRITTKYITNFERVRILGVRATQLMSMAKPLIKGTNGMNPEKIAQLELESGVIPLKIIRKLPDGKKEIWKVSELKLKEQYI